MNDNIELLDNPSLDNPSDVISSEGLDWESMYRCPNCDSMYDGCCCPNCGYNNNGGM